MKSCTQLKQFNKTIIAKTSRRSKWAPFFNIKFMNTNVDLYQLVECVGDAIIVADADEKIVLWNPAATRIFDYSEAEALGQALNLIVPKRQRQKTQ